MENINDDKATFGFDTNKISIIKNDLTQTDFSGLLGLEYVTPISLTINARFIQGFSNVYKAEFNSDIKTRHQIFAVTVGYIFNKKK